jgi:Pumilio-family RNA binding repeat
MNGEFKISYGENQRPRRPNEDTLAYIKSLPLEVEPAIKEIKEYLEKSKVASDNGEDQDYPQLFSVALTAMDEIRTEIASLAGDEAGSQFLEILVRVTAPYSELAARKLLAGCRGYFLHLTTHRYGSHVVQTLLQLSTLMDKMGPGDLAETIMDDKEDFQRECDALPSLEALIVGVTEELAPHVSELVVHICGSHVVRTLLCVLTGTDMIKSMAFGTEEGGDDPFRRGKKKLKKKKKKPDTTANMPSRGMTTMIYRKPTDLRINIAGNQAFSAALDTLTREISQANNTGVLQKFSSHPSAGPLVVVLLQTLTYVSCVDQSVWQQNDSISRTQKHLGLDLPQPKFQLDSAAHQLAKNILCWPDEDDGNDSNVASDVIYGLAGEPRGSHVLETLFWCSPGPFYDSILTNGSFFERATIEEYIDHPIGNFVIQTMLRTIQTKEQADRILKTILPFISSGSVIDAEKKRRGILWRTVELAARHRVGQDATLKAIRLGFASLQASKPEGNDATKKERRKASTISFPDCIVKVLDAKKDEAAGRLTLDVMGARTVYNLLRFAPRLCESTIDGIVSYPTDVLIHFAKDGLASACIWDGILEGPTESPTFSKGIFALSKKLTGHWVSLSCDRCGQHVVKKMFLALPEKDRFQMAEELSRGIPQLSGSSMGRSVMDTCAVRHISGGFEEWRKGMKRASGNKDEWEKELFGDTVRDSGVKKKKQKMSEQ